MSRLAAIAIFLALVTHSSAGPALAASDKPPLAGVFQERYEVFEEPRPVPETALTRLDGRTSRLGDFAGRVVLLNFWATWCAPCLEEMPSLDAVQDRLAPDGLTVIAVSEDRGGETVVRRFLEERLQIQSLMVLLDKEGELARELSITGLPTTYVIDRDGRMVGRLVGPAEWNSPAADELLRHYLTAPDPEIRDAAAARE